MPRVTAVTAVPFTIPLRSRVKVAIASFDAREHVLVRVDTNEGPTGYGEAVPRWMVYGETQASVVAAVETLIAPALVGLDLFDRSELTRRLRYLVGNHSARAAVDVALWDAAGKHLGQPVWRLLGGEDGPVPVAALLGFGTAAASAETAAAWREEHGVMAFKIKVGRDPATDAAVCAAIREAVGPDALLYADANQGFNLVEALGFARAVAPLGLAWLEEPVPIGDSFGRREFARKGALPLCCDETCRDLDEVRRAVLEDGCRVVSVKTARTGFTASLAVLDLCAALHVDVTVGSQGDCALGALTGLHLCAGRRVSIRRPAELLGHLGLEGDLADPPSLHDGCYRPSSAPGLGAAIDEDRLAFYSPKAALR